jgi:hypothetical protein
MGFFRRKPKAPKRAPLRHGFMTMTVTGAGLLNKGVIEQVQLEVVEWSQPAPSMSRISVTRVSGIAPRHHQQVKDLVPSLVHSADVSWFG